MIMCTSYTLFECDVDLHIMISWYMPDCLHVYIHIWGFLFFFNIWKYDNNDV